MARAAPRARWTDRPRGRGDRTVAGPTPRRDDASGVRRAARRDAAASGQRGAASKAQGAARGRRETARGMGGRRVSDCDRDRAAILRLLTSVASGGWEDED